MIGQGLDPEKVTLLVGRPGGGLGAVTGADADRDSRHPLRDGGKMMYAGIVSVDDVGVVMDQLAGHRENDGGLGMAVFVEFDDRDSGSVEFLAQRARTEEAVDRDVVAGRAVGQREIDGDAFHTADFE